jgi:hypothetical protein
MSLLMTLSTVLRDRLQALDPERGGFEIASSMAIAAFAIVAALVIFGFLTGFGQAIVTQMQTLITGELQNP